MALNLDDVVTLNVIGTVTGNDHVHTLSFRKSAIGNLPDLIAAWQTAALVTYRALFRTSDSPVKIIRAVHTCGTDPLDAPVDVVPAPASQLGSRSPSGHPLPSYVAGLVHEKGASAGRRRSGRFFLGGLAEDDTNGNLVEGTYMTLMTNYCNALAGAFITPIPKDWTLVTWSRTQRDEGGSCLVSSTPVASLIPRNWPTTMRSRKLGHGN